MRYPIYSQGAIKKSAQWRCRKLIGLEQPDERLFCVREENGKKQEDELGVRSGGRGKVLFMEARARSYASRRKEDKKGKLGRQKKNWQ